MQKYAEKNLKLKIDKTYLLELLEDSANVHKNKDSKLEEWTAECAKS